MSGPDDLSVGKGFHLGLVEPLWLLPRLRHDAAEGEPGSAELLAERLYGALQDKVGDSNLLRAVDAQ